MTRLARRSLKCPNCGGEFSAVSYASINDFMNPELIGQFLNNEFVFTCPHCGQSVHPAMNVMINCRKGMFTMSTAAPYEEKKAKLAESGSIYLIANSEKATKQNTNDISSDKKDPSPYAKPPPPPPRK